MTFYFWKFIHNAIIHPLMSGPWREPQWLNNLHDWTAASGSTGSGAGAKTVMNHLLTKLATITVAALVFSLAVNAFLGCNPFNRIGYALFVSVVPGIASFLLFRFRRLSATWLRVITIYLLLFAMTIILQGVLRGI